MLARSAAVTIAIALAAPLSLPASAQEIQMDTDPIRLAEASPKPLESGTVNVNGLEMYYQVHGKGEPLLLIHGGLMTIEAWGPLLPVLAESRKVYAIELEGHGRTIDLDRPLSIRQFSEDVGGFIERVGIGPVDIVGFSMGGGTALGLGIRRPDLVKSLVVISAAHQPDAIWDSVRAGWPYMSAAMLEGTPMKLAYDAVAPDPGRFPVFIDKIRDAMTAPDSGWTDGEVSTITAPFLLVVGDHDLVRIDKSLQMYALLGGQASHDPMGPTLDRGRQFAVIPAATHYDILYSDILAPIISSFHATLFPQPQG